MTVPRGEVLVHGARNTTKGTAWGPSTLTTRLELLIPRELKSPNTWQGRHWRFKHRESQDWQTEIAVALLTKRAQRDVFAILAAMNAVPPTRVCERKRRVMVTRMVPSMRNFIRDEDNLRFSTKPLNDALKRLGLIKNDSRKWLEQPMPEQMVASDHRHATRIVIEELT